MNFSVESSPFRYWLMKVRWVVPRPLRRQALLKSRLFLRLMNYESVMDGAGLTDMRELLDMVRTVDGDIVECGCNRCGTTVIMANHLRRSRIRKTIYACDTFDGFSVKELQREMEWERADVSPTAFAAPGQYEYVKEKLSSLGLDGQVVPVKGLFQDTFPHWLQKWGKLSFAFVDCDLEESMLFCARGLWPLLVPGGIMAFDDYRSEQFKGARIAVDRFVAETPMGLQSHGFMRRLYFMQK
jgi:Macrocin-O-methyltransferase (TylF)